MNQSAGGSFIIRTGDDVLAAVSRARQLACELGFSEGDRAYIVLAALDAADHAVGRNGTVHFSQIDASFIIRTEGSKPSHAEFRIPSNPPATTIDAPPPEAISGVTGDLRATLDALVQAKASSDETILGLEAELEETNRGVMALYAELDDRAEKLVRADLLKSRFLSYASHELRTPLNGIVGLIRMLTTGGEKRPLEEAKQLGFIKKAAEEMRELVNDLLDLAKVEAGKVTVAPSEFDLSFVFGALRGIFRPLLQTDDVVLIFDDTSAVPSIYSDEGKVSQILRNFISNALKFTEHGEIHVWAALDGDFLRISVSDTGIGLAPEHFATIFDEFAQIDSPLQRRVKGTGLGLPLCKKLAELLGGTIAIESQLGEGSVFTLILPRMFSLERQAGLVASTAVQRTRPKLLVIDDAEIDRYLLIHLLRGGGDYTILQAEDGEAGLKTAIRENPSMIFLDLNMPRLDGFGVLEALRQNPVTSQIPVVIVTTASLSAEQMADLQRNSLAILSKEALSGAMKLELQLDAPFAIEVIPEVIAL